MVQQPELKGVYHYSDNGVASWYDFAVAIQEEALRIGLLNREIPINAIPSHAYPTPARRPPYSVLDRQQTWDALGHQAPYWHHSLHQMLLDLKNK